LSPAPRQSTLRPDAQSPTLLQFDDNSLLPLLFGEHDQHLARIEHKLGVSIATRGNQVAITGPDAARDSAKSALDALYERLRQGGGIDRQDVDAAVRLADAPAETPHAGAGTMNDAQLAIHTRRRQIAPRSPRQAAYIQSLRDHELVFGLGPAGTGKTYLAVAVAVEMLMSGKVDRLILSRPAVEAGERLGFLPGDLREKVDPYLRPLQDALHELLPGEQVMKKLQSGEIEVAPLAFMRGRTLANSFIILDEAQNTTPVQMKMFLTRLGENGRMAVTGDLSQVDLPQGEKSGLHDACDLLAGMEGVSFVRFTDADVVRHELVTRIVRAYEARDVKRREQQQRGRNRGKARARDTSTDGPSESAADDPAASGPPEQERT
jgi:phosphate starvation-inducible PhoH-like protein